MSGVLERLARLEAEAGRGKKRRRWRVAEGLDRRGYCHPNVRDGHGNWLVNPAVGGFNRAEDAEFIAALRNAAPVLLDIAQAADAAIGISQDDSVHPYTRCLGCDSKVINCVCAYGDLRAALSRLDEVNLP